MSVSLANWNPYSKTVEDTGELQKKAINSKFTLIAALLNNEGKPVETWAETVKLRPIGLIQNYNLGQNKNIQQVFEIGSDIDTNLPGRTFKTFSFGRIFLRGKNLLSIIATGDQTAAALANDSEFKRAASGEIILNLASSYFDSAHGLAMLFYDPSVTTDDGDAETEITSGVVFEGCMVNAHQMSSSAGDVLVMESVSMLVSKIVPIPISSMSYEAAGGVVQPPNEPIGDDE